MAAAALAVAKAAEAEAFMVMVNIRVDIRVDIKAAAKASPIVTTDIIAALDKAVALATATTITTTPDVYGHLTRADTENTIKTKIQAKATPTATTQVDKRLDFWINHNHRQDSAQVLLVTKASVLSATAKDNNHRTTHKVGSRS